MDAEVALRILRTRMVPETEGIQGPGAAEARGYIIRIVLQLLSVDDAKDISNWATSTVYRWYREGGEWKASFEKRVQLLVRDFFFLVIVPLNRGSRFSKMNGL